MQSKSPFMYASARRTRFQLVLWQYNRFFLPFASLLRSKTSCSTRCPVFRETQCSIPLLYPLPKVLPVLDFRVTSMTNPLKQQDTLRGIRVSPWETAVLLCTVKNFKDPANRPAFRLQCQTLRPVEMVSHHFRMMSDKLWVFGSLPPGSSSTHTFLYSPLRLFLA